MTQEYRDEVIIRRGVLTEEFIKSEFYKRFFELELKKEEENNIKKLIEENNEEIRGKIKQIRNIRNIFKEWIIVKDQVNRRKNKNVEDSAKETKSK